MAETVDGLEDLALTWSGRALDVGRIEQELDKLRYMVSGQPAGGPGFALRTSLLNMVVYAEHEETSHYASRVIEDLASHHPSRALIVVGSPSDDESRIEAQLAAHSHMSQALEQSVCCEEVTLHVAGRAANHLHSIIVPLLVPDLPVYVWWAEQLPEDSRLFAEMLETADHLIIDSSKFDDQTGSLMQVQRLSEKVRKSTIGDLNWNRLETWRDLLTRQKSITQMRHHLSSVVSVEIGYAAGGGDCAGSAFLFLAWLAEELAWSASSVSAHGGGRFTLGAEEGRNVAVAFHAVDYPTVEPGWLVSVKIACKSETAEALISIGRTDDPHHLIVRTEHRDGVVEDHVRMERGSVSEMLMRELDDSLHNPQYGRVLRNAMPLMMASRV